MSHDTEYPMFWPGQTSEDWKRYDRDGYDLWFLCGRALNALGWDPCGPTGLPIYDRLILKPLHIRNSVPLEDNFDVFTDYWTPPAEFAAAADRLAAALEARDPEAAPFVAAYTRQNLQQLYEDKDRTPMKDGDWDTISQELRRIAQVARKVAEEGISLITLDMGEDGWAADPERKGDY